MDDFMKTEAKDIISTAIEKASGATGINIEVSITVPKLRGYLKNSFTSGTFASLKENQNLIKRDPNCAIVCVQVREGLNGPSIRSLLALCHGRGFLVRDYTPSKDHTLHVLRWQDRYSALQVLNE